ncbi:MAG: CusA/CzcA family heavy metal efflux RND transporter [Alphaproteobacteria bacterium]|nr:CusA/CzcA family heavy metal efflux RND transporter [Alphaproteobacteria bacterium]
MIAALVSFAIRDRWAVLFLTLIAAGYGVYQLTKLPLDALPDITNKQVMINYAAPELGPEEIEKRITYPVETALAGLAGVQSTRSFSRNGYGQVTAIFRDDANLYFMRQQVAERLEQAKSSLPPGIEPQLGPVSTGLGEIFMYSIEYTGPNAPGAASRDGQPGWQKDGSYISDEGEVLRGEIAQLGYLRTIQDWIIRPQLKTVPGVADVDSLGGYEKQYVVAPDPTKLAAYGLTYSDVAKALEAANLAIGANYIQHAGETYVVHADARIHSIDELIRAVVATRNNVPITVRDIADVRIGGEFRTGAASKNGREVVTGTVLMLTGENSRTVATAAREKFLEIRKNLPPGITANILLDRSQLVNATITTVTENLAIGALLVIATLLVLLGNFRAATIATLVIPLSFVMAAAGMNALGVPANLMSLGALDFGLIIDGAIIIVENTLRRIAEANKRGDRALTLDDRLAAAADASREMIRPTVYGQLVIFLVFVPCLSFQGIESKMFSPMVITLMLALASGFVLSLTFVPAMAAALLTRNNPGQSGAGVIRILQTAYAPVLRTALAHPFAIIAGAIGISAGAVVAFLSLGRVFIPTLDEINVDLAAVRIPSISMEQSKGIDFRVERALLRLPEVGLVFSKAGTANLVFDAMPPNQSDNYVMLRPKDQWPAGVRTKEDVLKRIRQVTAPIVGNYYEMTQPVQMRFNELISGVRSDMAVAVYGDDLDVMGATARRIASVLAKIRGAADVRIAQTEGATSFDVNIDRNAAARYGLTMEDIANTVSAAIGGRPAGQLFMGDRRYDIVVRVPESQRNDVDSLGALPVGLPPGNGPTRSSVALRQVTSFGYSQGLNEISRENGKRRIIVDANVRGRDIGSFADEARAAVDSNVRIPPGYWIEWGGQFANLQEAVQRLEFVVPICMILIFAVLYAALESAALAAAVFSAVPLALAGGVFAIAARGIPFSVSAAVGFIAVSGVAVLNGLVLMNAIRRELVSGQQPLTAIVSGALERVRPVVMTALVASLGFVPMAIATGTGAEVQKPLATVVIGGIVSSTALTLLVLPVLSSLVLRPKERTEATGAAARIAN